MKIRIFQVLEHKNTCFRNLESLQRIEKRLPIAEDYFLAWEGEVPPESYPCLENIYTMFNQHSWLNRGIPKDYFSRSMSVSDVVQIVESGPEEEEPGCYFVDSIGFKKLESFDADAVGSKLDALKRHFGTFWRDILPGMNSEAS